MTRYYKWQQFIDVLETEVLPYYEPSEKLPTLAELQELYGLSQGYMQKILARSYYKDGILMGRRASSKCKIPFVGGGVWVL